jgi:hypothetical protein
VIEAKQGPRRLGRGCGAVPGGGVSIRAQLLQTIPGTSRSSMATSSDEIVTGGRCYGGVVRCLKLGASLVEISAVSERAREILALPCGGKLASPATPATPRVPNVGRCISSTGFFPSKQASRLFHTSSLQIGPWHFCLEPGVLSPWRCMRQAGRCHRNIAAQPLPPTSTARQTLVMRKLHPHSLDPLVLSFLSRGVLSYACSEATASIC